MDKSDFLIKLNPYPTSSLHDMGICYDPPIGGNYDARSGGHATRQQIRVSVLAVTIWVVPVLKICTTLRLTRFDSASRDELTW